MFAKKSKLQELVDTVTPHVDAAREAAAPHVASAREKLVNDVLPAVHTAVEKTREQAAISAAAAAETAREQAGPAAAEAKRRGLAATAALKGEQPPARKGRLKKLLVLAGLAGAVAFVAKKLNPSSAEQPWQSSYAPKPPTGSPAATQVSSETPLAPDSPESAAGGVAGTDDVGGGTPGEVLADNQDQPHPVSTPEAPAEVIEIDEQPDSKRL